MTGRMTQVTARKIQSPALTCSGSNIVRCDCAAKPLDSIAIDSSSDHLVDLTIRVTSSDGENGGSYQGGNSSYGGQDRGNRSYGGGNSYQGGSYQSGGYQPRETGSAPKSYRDTQSQSQGGGFGGDSFPMDISELDPVSAPAPQSEDEADIPF